MIEMTEKEKKPSKWLWIIGAFIFLGIIGMVVSGNDGSVDQSAEPVVEYKWVEVWHAEYPHNVLDLYYDNDLPIFEIPSDTVHLKVEIDFSDGDKDSYIHLKLFRWGETDDYKIDSFSKNAKLGTGVMEKVNPKGTRYYVNLSAVSGLEFEFIAYAKIPK